MTSASASDESSAQSNKEYNKTANDSTVHTSQLPAVNRVRSQSVRKDAEGLLETAGAEHLHTLLALGIDEQQLASTYGLPEEAIRYALARNPTSRRESLAAKSYYTATQSIEALRRYGDAHANDDYMTKDTARLMTHHVQMVKLADQMGGTQEQDKAPMFNIQFGVAPATAPPNIYDVDDYTCE